MTMTLGPSGQAGTSAPVSSNGGGPLRQTEFDARTAPSIEVRDVTREFGPIRVLEAVSLRVQPREIHALLGPNGAGKTTLLRVLAGLTAPTSGTVRLLNRPGALDGRQRQFIGFIPAGDRSFYLRLSGLENLIFFARLQGLSHRDASGRAWDGLRQVDLVHAARQPVRTYSHGMYKRLGVARALLTNPAVLLVDEATHDLDPQASESIRALVRSAAGRGAAVIWATQRVDEIRGFADTVTLIHKGAVRFSGSVAQLSTHSLATRYLLRIRGPAEDPADAATLATAVANFALLTRAGGDDAEVFRMELRDGAVFGDALSALTTAGVSVLACHQERADIERAFLDLTRDGAPA